MTDNYKVSDFGHAVFVAEKKDFNVPTDCYGTIKMIENKYVLFEDNNGTPYLIEKKNFQFEAEIFKPKL